MIGINCGSGQRPFREGWINIDCQERWREASDKAGGEFMLSKLIPLPFSDNSVPIVVAHHLLEHFDVADGEAFLREAYRVIRPGGELLVYTPNMEELCRRWLSREIGWVEFRTHTYGAYMGDEADRHKNCWGPEELLKTLWRTGSWLSIERAGNRIIRGADIAGWAFWILDYRCVK